MASHSQLSGAELHEPKGAENATSGQVYVADGAGSGAWTTLAESASPPIIKFKDGDMTKNVITLGTDIDLFNFQLSANINYKLDADIYWSNATGGTAGIQMTFEIASGTVSGSRLHYTNLDPDNNAILTSGEVAVSDTFTVPATTASGVSYVRIGGYVSTSAATVLNFQFAQDVLDAANVTTLHQGCTIGFTPV